MEQNAQAILQHLMDLKAKQALTLERVDGLVSQTAALNTEFRVHKDDDATNFAKLSSDHAVLHAKGKMHFKVYTAVTAFLPACGALIWWIINRS